MGYREHLEGIEVLFGQMNAPYFPGPEFNTPIPSNTLVPSSPSGAAGSGGFGKPSDVVALPIVEEARSLWEGWRGMEEYAREVFPVEEEANGLDWMI